MDKKYKGPIVEESLDDNRILNELEIVSFRVSKDENPSDRWHLYQVQVSRRDIDTISKHLNSGKWYMHFWDSNRNVIAVFRDRIFEFNYDDKPSWKAAIEYGKSIGIPAEQLDFIIE